MIVTMGQFVAAGIAIAGVNAVLLAVLTAVWIRNYLEFRSEMVLGLVAFSVVLLIENLVAVYFFFASMRMLYSSDPVVGQVVLVMRSLMCLAILFLSYVTMK
jgi:hypothetical protein